MDEYQKRRQELCEKMAENSMAIIPSAKEAYRNADTHYPFRQNSDFYYITGFSEPDAIAVLINKNKKHQYILFNRPRNLSQEVWTGYRAGQEGAVNHYGANESFAIDEFKSQLATLLEDCEHLYFSIGKDGSFDAQIFQVINQSRQKVRQGISIPNTYHCIEDILHEMRLFKSADEIDLMRKAVAISAEAHKAAMKKCQPGIKEYQLEAVLLQNFYEQGSRFPAYSNIVAAGKNACVLHYIDNQDVLQEGELVLIDAGAEYQNYASDITRTFPVNGKFSELQKKLYSVVLNAQKAVIEMIKPGVYWNELQAKALESLTQGLHSLGIINSDEDVKQFYMHNIGHWLGLDVHDAGSYRIKKEWRKLQPGMVLTVEPGIYIAKDCQTVDKQWRGIGIRIEDDVLVTPTGYDVLSSAIPKEIADIERIMSE